MDGLCAARELRADPATAHLTIVGLTAHAMKGDEGIALGAGFDGYLTKPIDTRTFVATVNELIAARSKR
jgi:two-component system cell cycle response regulator DivK